MTGDKLFYRFMTLWSGELISSIGSGMTAFALSIYVFQQTGLAANVGLITLLAFLPTVLLSPIAGVLADRFDRRLLMIIGDGFSAFGLLFMLVCHTIGGLELWQICVGVAFSSTFTSLLEPSYRATITDLLTEDNFAKASGLVQMAGAAKFLISPLVAGFLLTITGIETILIIDISTFLVTLTTILVVKKSIPSIHVSKEKVSFVKDFKDGMEALTAKKGIMTLIILTSLVTFFIGCIQTLNAPMFLHLFDEKTLGIFMSISSIGILVGSMFIGIFGKSKHYAHMIAFGFAIMGIAMVLFGSFVNIFLITASGFILFSALPFINTGADVLIRTNIPNEKQGRVWGLIGVISQLGYLVAYGIAGILADKIFLPLLMPKGALAGSIGKIIGVGASRGIGFMFVICGIFVIALAILTACSKSIKALDVCG